MLPPPSTSTLPHPSPFTFHPHPTLILHLYPPPSTLYQAGAQDLVQDCVKLARIEGLEGHARAAECRLTDGTTSPFINT